MIARMFPILVVMDGGAVAALARLKLESVHGRTLYTETGINSQAAL